MTRSRPGFWNGVARVFDLSLGEMLWSRRTIFMAVVLAAPVILALAIRIVEASGVAPLRVNGAPVSGTVIFGIVVWWLYVRFVVPVLGIFYGTSLIADEVEDKTLTYLFTRPVPRSAVLLGKYLAYLVCTGLVVLPSLTIVFFLLVPWQEVGAAFGILLTDLGLLLLGLAAYGALFTFVGTVMKRPLVAGLVFVFGWEQVAMVMPGYLRQFTLVYYLQGLVPHAIPTEGIASLLATVFGDSPSLLTCVLALGGVFAVSLLLAMRAVERREYVLGQ
jgi:ABC-2 type transport system permease protein